MTTSGNQWQPPAGLTAGEPFVSAHGRALVVVGLFAAWIATAVLSVGVSLSRFVMEPVVLSAEGGEQVTLHDLLTLLVGLPTFLIYLALVVAFLMWLHRVSKNLPALGNARSRVEYSPGWAVGSFFVPFVNLVVPYKAVSEVWEKSHPTIPAEDGFMSAPREKSPLLLGWWLAWIASNVLSNISWRMERGRVPGAQGFEAGVDIASDLLGILAAALAILVVRGIDRRQAERARQVSYVSVTPPPPPHFSTPPPQGT